jgi:Spy/CpxP family protein refolding chaperone
MHSRRSTTLAVITAACLCGPALGQKIPAKEAHISTPPLITVKSVQQELKMTDEQIKKVAQIPEMVKKKLQEKLNALDDLEGRELREKSKEAREQYRQEFPKLLAEILTPEQMARLNQIHLQFIGVKAFVEPSVVKAMNFTDEQKAKIDNIIKDNSKETFEVYLQSNGDAVAARKKVDALNKKQMDRALAVLTDEQKAKWKEVTKTPFDVKFDALPERPKKEAGQPQAKLRPELTEDLGWVAKKVEEWQPAADERFFDLVGWADDIRHAIRLGKENNRPVFVMNSTGSMPLGLC